MQNEYISPSVAAVSNSGRRLVLAASGNVEEGNISQGSWDSECFNNGEY